DSGPAASGASVSSDRGPAQGVEGDRRRPHVRVPHEPAPSGGRRVRQDGGGGPRRAFGGGERVPGGVHGPDRNPRRAATPIASEDAARDRISLRAPHRRGEGPAPQAGPERPALGSHSNRRRYARTPRKGGAVSLSPPGHHRRAASLRRGAARRA